MLGRIILAVIIWVVIWCFNQGHYVAVGAIGVGCLVVLWQANDPCPKCGWKISTNRPVRLDDVECGRCRHVWIPEWRAKIREREKP